jgi:phosphoglucomutase/phosphomannomutase
MDRRGPERFVFGAEESYGYLAGDHVRDKDAAVASMLLCELAARLRSEGRTLVEKLQELLARHGCHRETQFALRMPGEEGMDRMNALLSRLRGDPPESIGGMSVVRVRDYAGGTITNVGRGTQPLDGPRGDLLFFDLQPEGNAVAVRPSGTEAKIKFYMFVYDPPQEGAALESIHAAQAERLAAMEQSLRALAEAG